MGGLSTKSVEDLYAEIEDGEAYLVKNGNELLRAVKPVAGVVYYDQPNGKRLKLIEDRQVFEDGTVRKREYLGRASISEKSKKDESAEVAIKRAVIEELGIDNDFEIKKTRSYKIERSSNSYPNLKSCFFIKEFEIIISDDQFKESGYVEKDGKKTTYFVWEENN